MAFSSSSDNDDVLSEINITPLVDVMLVLLVAFIVTAPLLNNAVHVNLPNTVATAPADRKPNVTVSVDDKGVVYLDKRAVALAAVPAELAERLGLSRGAPVMLHTANGQTTGYRTVLNSLSLGDIVLRDVRAIVAPGFRSEQVLLGMSALKQLEFTQRAGTLVLRQHVTDRP